MLFDREFLAIQVRFAQRMAAVRGVPLEHALFVYTSLPIRFGVPFSELVESHPRWQLFLARLRGGAELLDAVDSYHQAMRGAPPMRPQHGCFSFDYLADERVVRLHFANNDDPEPGVLSDDRLPIRLKELTTMFRVIRAEHSAAEAVISTSWIFHVAAIRRMLPSEFTTHLVPRANDYRSLGLWGQFLDKYGSVKPGMKLRFLWRVDAATTLQELEDSFPLKELKAESSIAAFYHFCGIP